MEPSDVAPVTEGADPLVRRSESQRGPDRGQPRSRSCGAGAIELGASGWAQRAQRGPVQQTSFREASRGIARWSRRVATWSDRESSSGGTPDRAAGRSGGDPEPPRGPGSLPIWGEPGSRPARVLIRSSLRSPTSPWSSSRWSSPTFPTCQEPFPAPS